MNLNYQDQTYYEDNGRKIIAGAFKKQFGILLFIILICIMAAITFFNESPVHVSIIIGITMMIMMILMIAEGRKYILIKTEPIQVLGEGTIVERTGTDKEMTNGTNSVFALTKVDCQGEIGVVKVPARIFRTLRVGDSIMLIRIGDEYYAVPLRYSDYSEERGLLSDSDRIHNFTERPEFQSWTKTKIAQSRNRLIFIGVMSGLITNALIPDFDYIPQFIISPQILILVIPVILAVSFIMDITRFKQGNVKQSAEGIVELIRRTNVSRNKQPIYLADILVDGELITVVSDRFELRGLKQGDKVIVFTYDGKKFYFIK